MSGDYEQAKLRAWQSEGAYVTMRPLASSWEQHKLGEIFSPGDEKNNYLEFDTDKTISVSTMSWNPGGNGAAAASLPLFKVLWYGDLAFEGNRTKGHPYGKLVINDIGAGIMSSRFRTLTARQAPCVSFWKFFLLNDAAFRPIYINCTKRGTLMTELVVPELLRSNVVLPSEAEQSLIGAYFRQLEHLITLHQREPPHMMKEGNNANRYQRRIAFLRLLLAMD